MNAYSNSRLFSRPRASIVPAYSEVQRLAQYASTYQLPTTTTTIGSFETVWPEKDALEVELVNAIENQNAGLTLSRAEATFTIHDANTWQARRGIQRGCAYRLASAKHHARLDFTLLPFRAGFAGLEARAIMLEVEQGWRGSFFGLRCFLDEVEGALFGLKSFIVYRIIGHASSEVMPSHKLVKLYERIGAVKMQDTAQPVMAIVNPKTVEFLEHLDPLEYRYFREARGSERRRVPPLPNYRQAAPSCQ